MLCQTEGHTVFTMNGVGALERRLMNAPLVADCKIIS